MYCHFLHGNLFFFLGGHVPTPTLSLEIGIHGVPAARLTPAMPVGMSDARIQVACPGHGRHWLFRGQKNELSDLISGGSTVLLCARLFGNSASLVPHVAAHINWWQIRSENVGRFSWSRVGCSRAHCISLLHTQSHGFPF